MPGSIPEEIERSLLLVLKLKTAADTGSTALNDFCRDLDAAELAQLIALLQKTKKLWDRQEAGSSTGRTARDPVLAFSVIGSAIVLILGLVKGFAYPNLSILDWDQFVGSGGMLLYGGNKAVADCRGKAAESLISAEKAAEIAAKAQALADVLKGLVNSAGVNQLALLEEFGKLEHAMAVERPQHAAVKLQYQNLLLQFNEQKQQNEALKLKYADKGITMLTLEDLSMSFKVYEGAQSVIYLGSWLGEMVAVKLEQVKSPADVKRFRCEAELLHRIRHPNVLKLLAAKFSVPDCLHIFPYMHGSCEQQLSNESYKPLWKTVLRTAEGFAAGMEHVHNCGVIHQKLQPSSLLMSVSGEVCITGFRNAAATAATAGCNWKTMCVHGPPVEAYYSDNMIGRLEYMAPEVLMNDWRSTSSDIYAFGVIINQMATGRIPFSESTETTDEVLKLLEKGYGREALAAAVSGKGLRPMLPKDSPPGYDELIVACWQQDPEARPTFHQVLKSVQTILAQLVPWEGRASQNTQAPPSRRVSIDVRRTSQDAGGSSVAGGPPSPRHRLPPAPPVPKGSDLVSQSAVTGTGMVGALRTAVVDPLGAYAMVEAKIEAEEWLDGVMVGHGGDGDDFVVSENLLAEQAGCSSREIESGFQLVLQPALRRRSRMDHDASQLPRVDEK